MFDKLLRVQERRRHTRHEAAVEIRVAVELYGFKDNVEPFFASGVTFNVSLGGCLANLDAPVTAGSVCNIFFRETGDAIRPHHVSGRIVRCAEDGEEFRIAVEFDEPLLSLRVEKITSDAALA